MNTIKFNNRYNNLIELQEIKDNVYQLNTNAHYIREIYDGDHFIGIDPEGGPMFNVDDEHLPGIIDYITVQSGKYLIHFK